MRPFEMAGFALGSQSGVSRHFTGGKKAADHKVGPMLTPR